MRRRQEEVLRRLAGQVRASHWEAHRLQPNVTASQGTMGSSRTLEPQEELADDR